MFFPTASFLLQLKCIKCGHCSDTFDAFMDLSMELSRGVRSTDVALKRFMATEKLGTGNEWRCGGCKKLVQAEKSLSVFKVSFLTKKDEKGIRYQKEDTYTGIVFTKPSCFMFTGFLLLLDFGTCSWRFGVCWRILKVGVQFSALVYLFSRGLQAFGETKRKPQHRT